MREGCWVKLKMADIEDEAEVSEPEDKSDFSEVVKLVWGQTVNEDLLRRWSQGTDVIYRYMGILNL